MRRFLVLCTFLLAAITVATNLAAAQPAFANREKVISGGLGLGLYGLYGSSTLPPVFVAFDAGVADKITAGGIVAYAGSSEDFLGGKWKYSYIVFAARGAYHFIENNKNWDAYAGAGLGYNVVSSSVEYSNPTIQHFGISASGSYFFFDIFGGGRYFFSPQWAAMAEVGYGVGFLRIGVSYRL
jgi:hypothetical protein